MKRRMTMCSTIHSQIVCRLGVLFTQQKLCSFRIHENSGCICQPESKQYLQVHMCCYSPAVGGMCQGEEACKLGCQSDFYCRSWLCQRIPASPGQTTQNHVPHFDELSHRYSNIHLPQRNPKGFVDPTASTKANVFCFGLFGWVFFLIIPLFSAFFFFFNPTVFSVGASSHWILCAVLGLRI